MEKKKPPVLSEEEIEKWCSEHKAGKGGICYVSNSCEICRRTIQRDANVEWYEKKYLIPDYEWNLEQARQNTAREIFEEIIALCRKHRDNWEDILLDRADIYASIIDELISLKENLKDKSLDKEV